VYYNVQFFIVNDNIILMQNQHAICRIRSTWIELLGARIPVLNPVLSATYSLYKFKIIYIVLPYLYTLEVIPWVGFWCVSWIRLMVKA